MAMERTRIAKVEDVTLSRRGDQVAGTLHLTPHHLIFVHTPPPPTNTTAPNTKPPRPRELWITYPIIQTCTLRISPSASRQPSSIRLRCRDFTFACFYLHDDRKARDVYDSIRAWTCKLSGIDKLYAFSYQSQGPEKDVSPSGWSIYNPEAEFKRMGVGDLSRRQQWRVSRLNHDYTFSPTYPSTIVVPSAISDNTLNYAARYRSRARIPVLTYLHPVNDCSITRCSQPLVGVRGNRSIQDEKLLAAIFNTTRSERPLSAYSSPVPEREDSGSVKDALDPGCATNLDGDLQHTDAEALEDAVIARLRGDEESSTDSDDKKSVVYGAQQRNMIIDARPTVNALAMQAVGAGSEDMNNYKFATKAYLGIDNIHVMRDSLQKVVDALKDSDLTPLGPNREMLQKSNWLRHIATVLDGVSLIARQVGLQHSHVLIHCSDGWDRTSQLSALSQICLDPYYRTIQGFIVLVEKDWLSFGHMFKHRSGFLSSEKWFQIENERISRNTDDAEGRDPTANNAISGAQKSLENAFLSAKGFFSNSKHNDSRESIVDSDADIGGNYDSESQQGRRIVTGNAKKEKEKLITKVKETAPIFHQFLDATYQLMYQHPTRFEFTERFLRRLLYHLYSCQYGTFLLDSERERKDARLNERTKSVWDYFLARQQEFVNPKYDPVIDDNVRGRERLIFPRTDEVRWWNELFGRTDDEMNGKPTHKYAANGAGDGDTDVWTSVGTQSASTSAPMSRSRTPVLVAVENSETSIGLTASPGKHAPMARSKSPLPLRDSLASTTHHPDEPVSSQQAANVPSAQPPFSTQPSFTSSQSKEEESAGATLAEPSTRVDDTTETPLGVLDVEATTENEQVAVDALAGDLDPLGIGDVKDHVSQSKRAQTAQERRKEQMELLMK
ncbi:hypothetical protein B0A52_05259 [Exophiala mesophila]|uniref:Myotubularin phosphatase domain-containing protein n=1 Tax=Exophiala mesophila TaxID=212818 RepID=A0A438N4G0_EXOME|nr:hypothetical protein B0A52_05259 [Exophiala mesophila]